MTTTANWLECPVCEYRFSVPPEYLDKSGKCPKCENVFLAADCQLPEKELADNLAEPPIPLPKSIDQDDSSIPASATPTAPPPPVTLNDSKPAEHEEVQDLEQTFVAAEKKQTDPNKVLIWVSISCILAITLLIGIPAIATMIVNQGQDKNKDAVAGNDGGDSGSGGAVENTRNSDSKNKKSNSKRGKAKKNAKPNKVVKNFTADELEAIWGKCYSGVALVIAKFGESNRTSHGVIISNDGKIAVNLSSIKGADSVRVRFALQEYGGDDRWSKPVVATTIVNSKPNLNLAIIHVDQVTNPVASRTLPIQDTERGVAPVLSNKSSDEFLRLTKLKPAQPFSDLAAADQESIKSLEMTPEGNDYFYVHSAKLSKNGIGAPIFDEEGLLVGMHVAHNESTKSSFLIPPAAIKKVLNDPLSKPVPIKGDSTTPAVATKSDAADVNLQPVSFETALNTMKGLEWKYFSPAGYRSAQQFAAAWWKVNIEHESADFTRKIKIEELQEDYAADAKRKLYWPSNAEAKVVNEMAIQAFRDKHKGMVALVSVLKPAGLAMDVEGEAAILVQLAQTNEKALLVPGEVEGPFIQGSQWIVFGWNPDSTRLNTADGKCMVIYAAGVKQKL